MLMVEEELLALLSTDQLRLAPTHSFSPFPLSFLHAAGAHNCNSTLSVGVCTFFDSGPLMQESAALRLAPKHSFETTGIYDDRQISRGTL